MTMANACDLLRQDGWGQELAEVLSGILDLAGEMFDYTAGVVVYGEPDTDAHRQITEHQKAVVGLERDVRRRLVARALTRAARAEAPAILMTTKAAQTARRLGVALTELHALAAVMPPEPDRALYQEYLVGRSRTLEDLLALAAMIPQEGGTERAGEVRERARALQDEAATTCARLAGAGECGAAPYAGAPHGAAGGGTPAGQDAVVLALLIRAYARVAGELGELATQLVQPLDRPRSEQ
jgi:hypothetical protein